MNTRRRITLIFSIIYCVLLVLLIGLNCFGPGRRASYTADSDSVSFMGYTYVSDNTYGFGDLYQISESGDVKKVYLTRMRSYVSGWTIEKLTTSSSELQNGGTIFALLQGEENDRGYSPFRIASYTDNLGTDSMSPAFFLRSGIRVTGFSYDDGIFYITGISQNRQDVYIYAYSEAALISFTGISTEDRETLNLAPSELKESSVQRDLNGRRYAQAEYANSVLHTHIDGVDDDEEYFTEDTDAKLLFDNRRESVFDRLLASGVSFVYMVTLGVIGCLAIYLVVRLLEHRRRVVYRIIIAEVVLFLICFFFVLSVAVVNHTSAIREYKRNTAYAMSFLAEDITGDMETTDYYNSVAYTNLYQHLTELSEESDNFSTMEDVCVVNITTGEIVLSLRGKDGGTVGYVYGDTAQRCVQSSENPDVDRMGWLLGKEYRFLSTQAMNASDYRLLCIVSTMTTSQFLINYEWVLLLVPIIVFVMGAILLGLLIRADSEVLDQVADAVETLGNGGGPVTMPEKIIGYDMHRIWGGINEIGKKLSRANRAMFMIYEAYYRFAPKQIETILGKEIITDVHIGDTKEVYGTVAFVISPSHTDTMTAATVSEKNRFISLTEKHLKRTDGIFVSTESDLSVFRLLFPETDRSSIRFGTDFVIEACADAYVPNPTVILHYDSFVYGVTGTDTLAYTFLSAEDADKLEHYATWLGSLGVNMMITEPVLQREQGDWDTRYIGFILPDPTDKERRINLYEVLDATDAVSRHNKRRMAEDFAAALEMFYEMDFYFARNAFTDILRESPTDEVAKWYLFECERLLNEEASLDFVGELHMDEA